MCDDFSEYMKNRYYAKFNKEKLLKKYNKKTNEKIYEISDDFSYIFYYILNTSPCYYWNEEVRKYTAQKLNKIIKNNDIRVNREMLHYFIIAYDTYQQITEIMQDMSHLELETKLKNRLYRIPMYTSITEGCLTNLYKFIICLINQSIDSKNYKCQNKLNSICEILKKHDFSLLVKDINVNIRNAINHGGVLMTTYGRDLIFYYMEKGQETRIKMYDFDFEDLINRLYDICSGILLGITQILNCNINILDKNDIAKNKYFNFKLLALKFSLPNMVCSEINDESIENKQLNIIMNIGNVEKDFLIQTAVELIIQVYQIYPEYKQYFVNFRNERIQICFIRLKKKDILGFIDNYKMIDKCLKKVAHRGDVRISLSEETKNKALKEIKYYNYPTYVDDEIRILNVTDISDEKRKKLRANLFVEDIQNKQEIVEKIKYTIKWLNELDTSFTNTNYRIKQGNMNADSIYLYVYHNDTRYDWKMDENNKNFICFVDYNIDGKTKLTNGGMLKQKWKRLFHEKIGNMQIAWREDKSEK